MKSTGKHRTDIPHAPGTLPEECNTCRAEKINLNQHTSPAGTDKAIAKYQLGASGGAVRSRSDSGFGRWLRKHERRKETMLTVPMEPEKPTPETTQPKSVTGSADLELSQTIGETKNKEEREALDRDQRKHLLFRTHRYLPSMTGKGNRQQIHVGAYRKNPKGHGLIDMNDDQTDIDRRN